MTPTAIPYKGVESYQPEDADLFFGRDREAERLLATIKASRFSLLHARSGAGKTSLLNARIIPLLEARGSVPIRILLQDEPIESTKFAALVQVLPPPGAELDAIDEAMSELPRDKEHPGDGDDPTFAAILNRFDKLSIDDVRRRELVGPIEFDGRFLGASNSQKLSCIPYFRKVLRMSLEIRTFADHLAAVSDTALVVHDDGRIESRIQPKTKISELKRVLQSESLADDYRDRINWLRFLPKPGLRYFFENLIYVYGRYRETFSMVLIFDQFEELFTRFVDRGPAARKGEPSGGSWRKRWEFINELKELYTVDHGPRAEAEDDNPDPSILPLRYVISIRDEYIAQLSQVRSFVADLEKSTLHLGFLSKENALEAIREPAERFGFHYTKNCYSKIIDDLIKEEHYVEPAHIQIVCDRLWRELRERRKRDPEDLHSNRIDESFFQILGDPAEILESFFEDFLQELSPREQGGVLEMLGLLITSSGTRNIVAVEEVVKIGTRQEKPRLKLLKILDKHNIVRVERRLEGRFAEIMHEFLINPIQKSISKDLGRYERLAGYQFREFMADLPSEDLYLEVLEILDKLISEKGGWREVGEVEIVNDDFRKSDVRRDLLKRLEKSFIVERSRRGKEYFVKICHDFLVRPIQLEIRKFLRENKDYKKFAKALPELVAAKRKDFRSDLGNLLPQDTLAVLEQHLDRLDWGYEGIELMFRSSLVRGESLKALRGWARRLEEGDATWSPEGLLAPNHLKAQPRPFALDELAKINAAREELSLPQEAVFKVLESEILMAGDEHREDIYYWARRWGCCES